MSDEYDFDECSEDDWPSIREAWPKIVFFWLCTIPTFMSLANVWTPASTRIAVLVWGSVLAVLIFKGVIESIGAWMNSYAKNWYGPTDDNPPSIMGPRRFAKLRDFLADWWPPIAVLAVILILTVRHKV